MNSVSTNFLRRLLRDRGGNVTTLYALLAPVLIFGTGAAIDYGRAAQTQSKLNAAADAAALAALTPNMLQQTPAVAQAAAISLFGGITDGMPGLSGTSVKVTISSGSNPLVRNVSVNYVSSVSTLFAAVLGKSSLSIAGNSQASAQIPPNIDFYVLLDNSPSMALPATTAGITQMQTLTQKQNGGSGCAFACHQADTSSTSGQTDTIFNPCADGTSPTVTANSYTKAYCDVTHHGAQLDNYALARKNNITLRLDELNSGVSTLLQTASNTAASSQFTTPPVYRFAIYSMDSPTSIGLTQLVTLTSSYLSQWASSASKFGVMEMYANNKSCATSSCSSGGGSGDVGTNYDDSLGKLSQTTYIPTPGYGSNQTGDTPQKVLFIVTDGVEDEQSGSRRLQQAINDLGAAPGGNSSSTNWCTTIKNRGIKIAVLYTDYLPVTSNAWYNSWIKPFQSSIAPALQACASPGLFYDAAIGSDLGGALASLFSAITQSGHLTQ